MASSVSVSFPKASVVLMKGNKAMNNAAIKTVLI